MTAPTRPPDDVTRHGPTMAMDKDRLLVKPTAPQESAGESDRVATDEELAELRALAEETFWVVEEKGNDHKKWVTIPWSMDCTRMQSIRSYSQCRHVVWDEARRRGLVRCIKVRIVPVNEADK